MRRMRLQSIITARRTERLRLYHLRRASVGGLMPGHYRWGAWGMLGGLNSSHAAEAAPTLGLPFETRRRLGAGGKRRALLQAKVFSRLF